MASIVSEYDALVERYSGKTRFSVRSLPVYHFMYHKSHIHCPGIESGHWSWEADLSDWNSLRSL